MSDNEKITTETSHKLTLKLSRFYVALKVIVFFLLFLFFSNYLLSFMYKSKGNLLFIDFVVTFFASVGATYFYALLQVKIYRGLRYELEDKKFSIVKGGLENRKTEYDVNDLVAVNYFKIFSTYIVRTVYYNKEKDKNYEKHLFVKAKDFNAVIEFFDLKKAPIKKEGASKKIVSTPKDWSLNLWLLTLEIFVYAVVSFLFATPIIHALFIGDERNAKLFKNGLPSNKSFTSIVALSFTGVIAVMVLLIAILFIVYAVKYKNYEIEREGNTIKLKTKRAEQSFFVDRICAVKICQSFVQRIFRLYQVNFITMETGNRMADYNGIGFSVSKAKKDEIMREFLPEFNSETHFEKNRFLRFVPIIITFFFLFLIPIFVTSYVVTPYFALMLLLVIGAFILNYKTRMISVGDEHLVFFTGVVNRTKYVVPYKNIQTVRGISGVGSQICKMKRIEIGLAGFNGKINAGPYEKKIFDKIIDKLDI